MHTISNSKKLVILRGVSGAGKSTVASMLSMTDVGRKAHFEADMYHYDQDGNYNWNPDLIHKAHAWCQEQTDAVMFLGYDLVVVSNTSTSEREIKPYLAMARQYGYDVISLVVENRHGNDSVHGVPQDTRDKQESRLRGSLKLQ